METWGTAFCDKLYAEEIYRNHWENCIDRNKLKQGQMQSQPVKDKYVNPYLI